MEQVSHRLDRRQFVRLGAAEGLPTSCVYALYTDKRGFLWVGTESGLARWDGRRFRIFTSDNRRAHTLPGGFILSVMQSANDQLWIGTYDGGGAVYHPRTERFTPVDLQPTNTNDNVIRCMHETDDGVMWFATHASLTALHPNGRVEKFQHPEVKDPFIVANQRFPVICPVDASTLFVGSAAGGFLFDTKRRRFEYLPFDDRGLLALTTHGVTAAAWLNGTLYVATSPQLYRFDAKKRVLTLVEPLANNVENQGYYTISSLAADDESNDLWIGTGAGLLRYDADTSRYSVYTHDVADNASLSNDTISAVHIDGNKLLWVATQVGVDMLNLRHLFRHVELPAHESPLAMSVANAVVHGDTHWIATGYGLVELNTATGHATRHDIGGVDAKGKRVYNQTAQVVQGKDCLWIAATGGLLQFDYVNRRVSKVYDPNRQAARTNEAGWTLGNHVQAIVVDKRGRVWCGSEANGMQWQHPALATCRYFIFGDPTSAEVPSDTLVASLQDSHGRLWFGFVTALSYFDESSDRFVSIPHSTEPESIGNAMITCLFEDRHRNLWVGTAAGLYRCTDQRRWRFRKYTTEDGLPSDYITAIVEHGDDLWVGTNGGVCRIRNMKDTVQVRVFTKADGLFSEEVNQRGMWIDGHNLYIGTKSGLNVCDVRAIDDAHTDIPVVLTDLLVFNESVPIVPSSEDSDGFCIDTSITESEQIELSHHETVFTVAFAALDFRHSRFAQYRYKLDGFDTRWIEAGHRCEATYTNLNASSYTLYVQAKGPDGIWCDNGAALDITVRPAPWNTWWARSLYAAAGVGAAALAMRSFIEKRERHVRQQHAIEIARAEEREVIRRQNAADFHDEAGTTLTRILFLSELARRKAADNNELSELLGKIDANAALLSQGMRDFIWVLDPDHDTLLDTIERVDSFAQSLFGNSDTDFTMRYDRHALSGIVLSINERRQLLMVCKEALHNAVKHAQASAVNIMVVSDGMTLAIEVVDDGAGFDTDSTSQGYGLKGMLDRAVGIGADLRVVSTPGSGTTVTLKMTLPRG